MSKTEKIHCIGVGGIGLSGLCQILHAKGAQVSGSDMEDSHLLDAMREKGIKITVGHDESLITPDLTRVIYSSAIPKTNVELAKAQKLNIPTSTFSEAVKDLTKDLYTIAVCGTHGKTTVTAFSTIALIAGEKDPTVIIGSTLRELGNANYRVGKGDYFIVEACEYKRNFLNYDPNIIILTNIEAEHLDYFKDLEDYKNAYREFIAKLPEDGYVIANGDDKDVLDTLKDYHGNIIIFSTKDKNADWFLNGNEIWKGDERVGAMNLSIPGEFNKLNALCGLILGQLLNIDRDAVLNAFEKFKGAWRRFEEIGNFMNVKLISDYAHHPTAIEKTIKAAKEKYPDNKICCIFQPHQYHRTKQFLPEFATAFKGADTVIIPNIYKVRDTQKDTKSVSADDLVKALQNLKINAIHIEDYDSIKNYLKENKAHIDIAMIMGAGDIWTLGEYLLKFPPETCADCDI